MEVKRIKVKRKNKLKRKKQKFQKEQNDLKNEKEKILLHIVTAPLTIKTLKNL